MRHRRLATLWLSRLHRATHFFGLCLIFAVLNAPLSLWPLIAEEPDLGAQLGVALFVTVVGSVFSLPLGIAYALAMAAPRRWLNARQPAQHDGAQRLEKATAWSSSVAIIAWFTCPCELGDSPRVAAGAALGLALWGLVVRVSQRRMLARVAAGQDARFEIAERSDAPAAALDAAARGPVLIARVVRSEGPFRDVVTRAPLLALGNVRRTVADGTGALLLAAIVMTAVLIGPTRVSLDPSADWSGSCR